VIRYHPNFILLRCLDVEALNHTIFFTIFRGRPKLAPEMFLASPLPSDGSDGIYQA